MSGVGLQLPYNAFGWIPLSIAIGLAAFQIVFSRKIHYTRLTRNLALCCLVLLVPLLYNGSDTELVQDRFLGLFAGLALLFGLHQFDFRESEKTGLLILVLGAVWLESLLGWGQVIANTNLVDIRPYNNPLPAGVFHQVNVMSSLLATGLVLSGFVLTRLSTLGSPSLQRIVLGLCLLLPVSAIPQLEMLASRTGMLGAVLGCVLLLPYMMQATQRSKGALWLCGILLGLLTNIAIQQLGPAALLGSQKEVLSLEGPRQAHYPQNIAMILEKPWTGYGYGNFEREFTRYTADAFARGEISEPAITSLGHPHNELLLWATEGGVLALMAVLIAAWLVLQLVLKLPLVQRLAMMGLFFPIVLHTQLEYPFYQSVLHWLVFILLIWWVDSLAGERRTLTAHHTLSFGVAGVLVPLVTTFFMATTLHTGYILARYEYNLDEDVRRFQSIINAMVWQDHITLAIYFRLVLNGIATGQPELARDMIEWAPGFLERFPRAMHYRYLILAYQAVGDEANAKAVVDQAAYLFPGEDFALLDPDFLAELPRIGVTQ
ncbi:MAG: hypothetical protein RLZZ385_2552 [Pseudomonadota bacterium]